MSKLREVLEQFFCRHNWRLFKIDFFHDIYQVGSYWEILECSKCKKRIYGSLVGGET